MIGGGFAKFCGLLRISELYIKSLFSSEIFTVPINFRNHNSFTAVKWAEHCANHVSTVDEFLDMIDYKIEDVLTFFRVGDLIIQKANMNQYWQKSLDPRQGFCYIFDPTPEANIKLSTDDFNQAMLLLDVSCIA